MQSIPQVKVETSSSIITINNEGVGHIHYKDYTVYDLLQQEENLNALNIITKGIHTPFVITAGGSVVFTKKAKDNSILNSTISPVSAYALIATNFAYRLIAQFYIKIHKPALPFKIFAEEKDGFEWCKQFVIKKESPSPYKIETFQQ
ncbi:MAG: hypothetical protein ABI315_01115 [Bacteroidia bacterium]